MNILTNKNTIAGFIKLLIALIFLASAVWRFINPEELEISLNCFGLGTALSAFWSRLALGLVCLACYMMLSDQNYALNRIIVLSFCGFTILSFIALILLQDTNPSAGLALSQLSVTPFNHWSINTLVILLALLMGKKAPSFSVFRFNRLRNGSKLYHYIAVVVIAFPLLFFLPSDIVYLHQKPQICETKFNSFYTRLLQENQPVEGKKMFCFFATAYSYNELSLDRLSLLFDIYKISDSNIYNVFCGDSTEINGNLLKKGKNYAYTFLAPIEFYQITDAYKSVLMLVDNGDVKKVYNGRAIGEQGIVDFFNPR